MQVPIPWLVEALGGRAHLQKRPASSSEVSNNPTHAKAVPDDSFEKSEIELKKASHLEKMLLSLAIKSRANFEIFLNSKVESALADEGIRSVFKIAVELYRQVPEKFDKLLSLLVAKVDQPEILFFNDKELVSEEDFEKETQLLKDCITRAKEVGLKDQLKKLALEMKDQPQADTVEKMKRLQEEIRDLNQAKV